MYDFIRVYKWCKIREVQSDEVNGNNIMEYGIRVNHYLFVQNASVDTRARDNDFWRLSRFPCVSEKNPLHYVLYVLRARD